MNLHTPSHTLMLEFRRKKENRRQRVVAEKHWRGIHIHIYILPACLLKTVLSCTWFSAVKSSCWISRCNFATCNLIHRLNWIDNCHDDKQRYFEWIVKQGGSFCKSSSKSTWLPRFHSLGGRIQMNKLILVDRKVILHVLSYIKKEQVNSEFEVLPLNMSSHRLKFYCFLLFPSLPCYWQHILFLLNCCSFLLFLQLPTPPWWPAFIPYQSVTCHLRRK